RGAFFDSQWSAHDYRSSGRISHDRDFGGGWKTHGGAPRRGRERARLHEPSDWRPHRDGHDRHGNAFPSHHGALMRRTAPLVALLAVALAAVETAAQTVRPGLDRPIRVGMFGGTGTGSA